MCVTLKSTFGSISDTSGRNIFTASSVGANMVKLLVLEERTSEESPELSNNLISSFRFKFSRRVGMSYKGISVKVREMLLVFRTSISNLFTSQWKSTIVLQENNYL